MMRRGGWLLAFALPLMLAGCHASPRRAVVLVTIDTLRADHVGATRDGVALTPGLDAFARDALRYTDVLANASLTVPSHAALLTGVQPFRGGPLSNTDELPRGTPTLAEALKARGFATAAVVSSIALRPEAGLGRGFDLYESALNAVAVSVQGNRIKTPDETTRVALEWLKGHTSGPFFLWVHYFPPHGPYRPKEEFLAGLRPPTPDAGRRLRVSSRNYERNAIPAYQRFGDEVDPEDYRRRYAASVREVDSHVGRLLDALRDAGVYDAATIVVTSDHGESLGEHGWYFAHGNLVYDEQVHVPLLIKPCGAARGAGRSVTLPVEGVDVPATVLATLGLDGVLPGDGRVVLPGIAGDLARPRFTLSGSAELRAIVKGKAKLVLRSEPGTTTIEPEYPQRALFDLAADPGELQDRSALDPDTARRLRALLNARYHGARPSTAAPLVDEEALQTLGYIR